MCVYKYTLYILHSDHLVSYTVLPSSHQRNDGTYPSMCTNEQLDTDLLESLADELSDKWPNVKSDDNSNMNSGRTSFWKHEWEKHGT